MMIKIPPPSQVGASKLFPYFAGRYNVVSSSLCGFAILFPPSLKRRGLVGGYYICHLSIGKISQNLFLSQNTSLSKTLASFLVQFLSQILCQNLPKPSKSPHQKSQKQQFLQKYDSRNPRKARTLTANTRLKSLFYGDLRFG